MILSTLLCLPILCAALDSQSRAPRRFLLAAASNDGGPDKIRLRYSGDDARNVVSVMRTLGRVREEDAALLLEPDTASFLSSLRDLSGRMSASRDSGRRVELVVYYSGHSDEDGLLLGPTRLSYSRLRRVLEGSPAEVRLAVLDACASGAALRSKGGIRREAFRIEDAKGLRGQAFLTSSRAEEVSQESDRIGGSFFTQAFLAGLRGAADADGDRRVTLLEAYRYAYEQTVERTSGTRAGAQHPEFDLDLSGSGDVVLTDLSQAGATLELDKELDGRIEVRDSSGSIVTELVKSGGRAMSIGLAAGPYRIQTTDSAVRRVAHVLLVPGARSLVPASPADSVFPAIDPHGSDTAPGGPAQARDSSRAEAAPALVDIPVNFGILPPMSSNGDRSARARNRFSLDLLMGEAAQTDGAQIALGMVQTYRSSSGIQLAVGLARTGRMEGLQAGFAAVDDGTLGGAQLGDVCAIAKGGGEGIQAASVLAWMGGDFKGIQASMASLSTGTLTGVQAGVFALSHGIKGAQLAVVNVGGSITGAQIGVLNFARTVNGAQVGVLNFAGRSSKAQVGVLNFADTAEGAMVGALNLAKRMDALPVGVISAGLDMRLGLETSIDETGWGTLALRLDGKRFHLKFAGVADVRDPSEKLGFGLGWGAHWIPADLWRIDADLLSRDVWVLPAHGAIRQAQWNTLSLSLHRRIAFMEVFAGISYNELLSEANQTDRFARVPGRYQYDPSDRVRLWPGVFVGMGI